MDWFCVIIQDSNNLECTIISNIKYENEQMKVLCLDLPDAHKKEQEGMFSLVDCSSVSGSLQVSKVDNEDSRDKCTIQTCFALDNHYLDNELLDAPIIALIAV